MESTVDSSHWIPTKSSPFDRDSTRCDGLRQRFATLHPGGDREFNQWLHGGVRKVMEVPKNGYHEYNLDGFCRGNFHLEMNDLGIAPLMYRGTQKISNRNMFPGWLFDDIYLILRGFQLFCSGRCYSPTGLLQMVEYHTEPIEHSSKKNIQCCSSLWLSLRLVEAIIFHHYDYPFATVNYRNHYYPSLLVKIWLKFILMLVNVN